MELCGLILKTERLKQEVSIEDISLKTKIHKRYIKKIENNDFTGFPASVYLYGFISLYASVLGLKGKKLVNICKRNMLTEKDTPYKNLYKKKPKLNIWYLLIPTSGGAFLVFLLYLAIKYNLYS